MSIKRIKLKKKDKKKRVILLYFFLLVVVITCTFNYLLEKNINVSNGKLVRNLLNSSNKSIEKEKTKINVNVLDLLNLKGYSTVLKKVKKKEDIEVKDPLIYIYNTHQSEEYCGSDTINNGICPTVTMNNYILKDILEEKGYTTLVEERSIKDILTLNNLNYSGSYIASRIYLDDVRNRFPSLKYFIDIHRDSVEKSKTTINLNDKNYAKVLFIVGLENENYEANYEFMSKINSLLDERYNGLSKGILQKGGVGVNGVYNQDVSPRTILIEIGGVENTIEEVMNTAQVVGEILTEVIKNES